MQASAVCGYEAALSWNGVEVMKYEIKVKHSDDNEPPPPEYTDAPIFKMMHDNTDRDHMIFINSHSWNCLEAECTV